MGYVAYPFHRTLIHYAVSRRQIQASGLMRKTALKLLSCLAAMPLSLLCIGLTHNGGFFLGFVVSLPLAILYWMDLGQAIRNSADQRTWVRLLGFLMGVPQALFGLACAATGAAIIGWVLYNTLIERQPEYSGGFLGFGIGPALVLFGVGWLVSAFRRNRAADEA